jgi:MFS family permease
MHERRTIPGVAKTSFTLQMAAIVQYRRLRSRAKHQLETLVDPIEDARNSSLCFNSGRTSLNTPQDFSSGRNTETLQTTCSATYQYAIMTGVSVQYAHDGEVFYQVDWESEADPESPRNWSVRKRIGTTLLLDAVAMVVTVASAIESAVGPQAAEDFGASALLQAFGGTGIFLVGFGIGALLAAPSSEILGRYWVYMASLLICGCWLLGAALAPNLGSHAAFRLMAGLFASAPLTVAGGSMSDLWNTREMTWAFPMFAMVGFGGPVAAPVIASYIGQSNVLSWRWALWLIVMLDGVVLLVALATMEETYGTRILQLKAKFFRELTGNERFRAASDVEPSGLGVVLRKNFSRPFMLALEPIVLFLTLYNTVVYVVQFTFLVGYPYIFEEVYGISQGLKNLCFLGLLVGVLLSIAIVPFVKASTGRQLRRDNDDGSGKAIQQESRLVFAMVGAPFLPIGLMWMAWTDYVRIPVDQKLEPNSVD